jgi:hypothetical protein
MKFVREFLPHITEVPSSVCDFCNLIRFSSCGYDYVRPVCLGAGRKSAMKLKIDRIISIATLVASLIAIFLVLKRPAPVAHPQTPAAVAVNAQSFEHKMDLLQRASEQTPAAPAVPSQNVVSIESSEAPSAAENEPTVNPSRPAYAPRTSASEQKAQVRINSDEVGAALAQALGAAGSGLAGGGELTPDSNVGSGQPTIKDQQVSFEGDLVHGQFLTEIAGKDVWVTVSGHLTSKDGYAAFDPTEFKVGDLSVPVSLVNPELQKKLSEQRDRLKLPDYVGDVKVENGELVMQQK